MGVESRIGMAGCRDGIIDSRSKLAHSSRLRTLGEYNLLGQRQSDSRAVPEDIDRSPCWIVYCKEIVQGSDRVLEYLGRYVHRTAISNRAVVSCTDRSVTFRYRSQRDDKTKLMTLSPTSFFVGSCSMSRLEDFIVFVPSGYSIQSTEPRSDEY